MKKQRTFYIDLVLAAICLLTLITGLIIHAAGHGIVQSNVIFTDKCDRPHPDIASGKCRHSFRNSALSGRYPVRHTGNLASVRTYENTPDNEKKLPPFSFASQSRKREEHIYLQRLTKNLFQFKYGFRLYIFRRSSYNSLKFSRFCNPFMLLVIKKAQRRFVYCKRNCFSFSSSQFDFTETF